jgi:small-conductance mechanosensitive channel
MIGDWLQQAFEATVWLLERIGISVNAAELTWLLAQLLVIAAAYGLAWVAAARLRDPIEARLREVKGNPQLLRWLAVLFRRLRAIFFLLLLWSALTVLRAATWPSRSYLVAVVASLATAWIVISIVSRIIRNQAAANLVAVVAWSVAALNIVGILPDVIRLLDGAAIELPGFRLSFLVVIKAIFLLSVLLWLAVALGHFAENRIRRIEDLTPSHAVLIAKLAKAGLLALAIVAGFSAVGIDFTALAVFSGAVGLGLGFGLQKVVSNLVSGIILLLDKSIKPGDVIAVGDTFGTISAMGARYVSVSARDGREFLIPNEDLITSQVVNWTFSSDLVRLDLRFGTGYDSAPREVRAIACQAAARHPRVVGEPKPVCHVTAFAESSIDFVLRFWIRDPSNGVTNVRGDIYLALWDALKAGGIDIPYPHRELVLRSPVVVETAPSAASKPQGVDEPRARS